MPKQLPYQITLLNAAAVGTTNSPKVDIRNADKVTIIVKRANHTAGSSAFTIDVSHDAVTWVSYKQIADNANAQRTGNYITTKTLSSNTSDFISMTLMYEGNNFNWMRINSVVTTDGDATAIAMVESGD